MWWFSHNEYFRRLQRYWTISWWWRLVGSFEYVQKESGIKYMSKLWFLQILASTLIKECEFTGSCLLFDRSRDWYLIWNEKYGNNIYLKNIWILFSNYLAE